MIVKSNHTLSFKSNNSKPNSNAEKRIKTIILNIKLKIVKFIIVEANSVNTININILLMLYGRLPAILLAIKQ